MQKNTFGNLLSNISRSGRILHDSLCNLELRKKVENFEKEVKERFLNGFSLIELMISLITISCITAAFTPVITKKLKNSNVSIALSELTTKCQAKFTEECSLCYSQKCVACSRTCGEYQYKNTGTCQCENCSDRGVGCAWCDGKYCTSCHWGYGYDSTTHTCTLCQAGTYSTGNGPCQKCPKGQYQASSGKHYCDVASAGHYVPEEGATEQIQCDYGHYQNETGKDSCKPCSAGWAQWTRGQTGCIACGGGWYQPNAGQRWCAEVGQGYYSEAGPQTLRTPCPIGKYQSSSTASSCENCSEGQYQDETGKASCKPCPNGKWSAAGSSSCTLNCQAGYKCVSGVKTQCTAGTYATAGSESCTACSAGQYQPSAGQSSCNPCWAGSYQNSTGKTSCNACGSGTYSWGGASSCAPCTNWDAQCTTCSQNGCTACKSGYLVSGTGCKTSVVYCGAGYYSANGVCTACPAGTYASGAGTRTSCTNCTGKQEYSGAGAASCSTCSCSWKETNSWKEKEDSGFWSCWHEERRYCNKANDAHTNCDGGVYEDGYNNAKC